MIEKNVLSIKRYSSEHKQLWDNFVSCSKNGVFLFFRNYMEYHSNRFQDHSLMFFKDNRLVALLPANIKNNILYSHEGLTFGGVISGYDMKTDLMLDIFDTLTAYCKNQGITEIVYKTIPYIYHLAPADEDLYALFDHRATLLARSVSSCICSSSNKKVSSSRKANIRRAKKYQLTVERSQDFASFMKIVQETLSQRHGVKPVHSAQEMELLAERFPDNIKLFASYKDGRMLAGLIIYESANVAHAQYGANSNEGWDIGAQDIIEEYLIKEYYKSKKFFDFGISTEELCRVLNLGLLNRKESFGASAVMYDIYQLII